MEASPSAVPSDALQIILDEGLQSALGAADDAPRSLAPAPLGAAKAPFWLTFSAGGASGTIGAVITNPLEVVKTRMQSSMHRQLERGLATAGAPPRGPLRALCSHVGGTIGVLRSIHAAEGMGALWRGMGATVVGVMPARAIYFSSYSEAKRRLADALNGGDEQHALIHLTAALSAGILTSTATNPIWMVKTRMQLQQGGAAPPYRNSLDCLCAILRTEGVRGLYRGLTASYLGAAEGTIQWVLYERMKITLARRREAAAGAAECRGAPAALTWADLFGAAAAAKLVAVVASYPHEVLRTRLREGAAAPAGGLVALGARILREEGAAALYGGMTAHLMRTVPNSAIMFFCYECIIRAYTSLASP